MPLIELDPPSTRPRGCLTRLPPSPGSGSVSNFQLMRESNIVLP